MLLSPINGLKFVPTVLAMNISCLRHGNRASLFALLVLFLATFDLPNLKVNESGQK
jgi:hypothetical protein